MENTFTNIHTGEVEDRNQYGVCGYVWLSPSEINYLDKYCRKKLRDKDLQDIVDEVSLYMENNPDKRNYCLTGAHFYLRRWIDRQVNYPGNLGR